MLMTTTDQVEGRRVTAHHGIVTGEAIVGANVVRDFFAKVRDVVGGRAGGYENALRGAKQAALEDMGEAAKQAGANAVIGVKIDCDSMGQTMMMVSASGTAVTLA